MTERSTAWHFRAARLGVSLLAIAVAAAAAYDSLPAFFMAVAGIMVVLALAALFQSLRTAFGERGTTAALRVGLPERAALLDEKNVLLRAIKDIAFEREVGKLSDADFERLDRAYRHRAKDVLRKLDEDLVPFLDRAERIVDESVRELSPATPPARGAGSAKRSKKKGKALPRRDCPACDTSNPADASHCKECGASVVPLECAACGATNEADAKFCKKCAASLQPTEAPSGAEASEEERAQDERAEDERAEDERAEDERAEEERAEGAGEDA